MFWFFRCLLKDRILHYKPEKASCIINACVVLHNICINNNVPMYEDNEEINNMSMMEDEEILADNYNMNNRNMDLILGRQQRDRVVQYLFNRNNVV